MDLVIDRLERSSRRTVGLRVTSDGRLEVRAPWRLPEAEVRRLVRSKAEWIRRAQETARVRHAERPVHRYAAGETFLLRGEPCRLEIVEGRRPDLEFDGVFRLARSGGPRGKALFEAWYRRRAAEVFAERAAFWGGRMGVRPARLLLSGARTKWGSCDARGTVRLAWRLVMAPPAVLDYVVVHELAHLSVRGHSRRFWDRVEAFDPDYRAHRRWLAERGHTLGL
jgi:hypothetical protein